MSTPQKPIVNTYTHKYILVFIDGRWQWADTPPLVSLSGSGIDCQSIDQRTRSSQQIQTDAMTVIITCF